MKESSFKRKHMVSTDELCDCFRNISNLLRMHENILSITRTESKFSDQREYLVWNTDNPHFFDCFASQIGDEFFCVLLIFLYYFLYTSWLNTFVFYEVFERFFGDISAKKVETREKYSIGRIIYDERDSRCLFKSNNIASLFSDDFPF